jgi:hypothetical protein
VLERTLEPLVAGEADVVGNFFSRNHGGYLKLLIGDC